MDIILAQGKSRGGHGSKLAGFKTSGGQIKARPKKGKKKENRSVDAVLVLV